MITICSECKGLLEKPRTLNINWAVCQKCQARKGQERYKKRLTGGKFGKNVSVDE